MKVMSFASVENYCERLQVSLNELCKKIGPIQIGTKKQFPDGWGKAAKGRTVWRIVEEAINQNLKKNRDELGFSKVCPSNSEASLYDVKVELKNDTQILYLNFKAAVAGKQTKKGDISKAESIVKFFDADVNKQLFIVTFGIVFHASMAIEIKTCLVTPITWLPDIYVNPSNNGNLQCSQPATLNDATRRGNRDFLATLKSAMKTADEKRQSKNAKST
jgi:hypothetical protein